LKKRFFFCGKNVSVDLPFEITNERFISLGKDVKIGKDCWILCPDQYSELQAPVIIIEDGVNIGRRVVISGVKRIHIHKNCLFAPQVYIADHFHKYTDINSPIKDQGITKVEEVEIGEGTWIGINACILPGCKIGKQCVIGANSVVTKSFPDYSVIGGNPARVIKQYSNKTKSWEKVKNE